MEEVTSSFSFHKSSHFSAMKLLSICTAVCMFDERLVTVLSEVHFSYKIKRILLRVFLLGKFSMWLTCQELATEVKKISPIYFSIFIYSQSSLKQLYFLNCWKKIQVLFSVHSGAIFLPREPRYSLPCWIALCMLTAWFAPPCFIFQQRHLVLFQHSDSFWQVSVSSSNKQAIVGKGLNQDEEFQWISFDLPKCSSYLEQHCPFTTYSFKSGTEKASLPEATPPPKKKKQTGSRN